ncbi:hypothetical protein TNCV_948301 [Trichonephila clavipes]|nr:hypothetical protein TNCV_948301 [Trichonephila clavipes]
MPNATSVPVVSTSSSCTQAQPLPFTSSVAISRSSESHIHLFLCLLLLSPHPIVFLILLHYPQPTLFPSTCPMFAALSTVISPVPKPTTSTYNSLPTTITSSTSMTSKRRKKSTLLKPYLTLQYQLNQK